MASSDQNVPAAENRTKIYQRQNELTALVEQGRKAVPTLIKALREPEVGWAAAKALGRIGPDAHEAVPALIEAMNSRSVELRRNAALALGQIGAAAKESVPALIDMLLHASTGWA